METTKLHYLQVPFNNLPVGTPVYECEPSSAHLVANAIVGRDVEPARYFIVAGEEGENAIMRIPSFKGIVGEVHPLDKTVVGPFVAGSVSADYDKLGNGVNVLIAARRNYPFVEVKVVIDPDLTYADIVLSVEASGMKASKCDLPYGGSIDSVVLTVVKAILFSGKTVPVPGFKIDSSVHELIPLVANQSRFVFSA